MTQENKVVFIINKHSGGGYQSRIDGKIIDACAKLNIEGIIEYTNHRGHATELARLAVEDKIPRVFAMGGDGTVNEVAQGVAGTPTAMGILPKGSGNGLARHLGIPLSLSGALKVLEKYDLLNMDVLRVNGRISVNVSGIGFDGHVAGKFGKDGKRGLMGYSKLVLKEFMRYKEFESHAVVDGEKVDGKSFIIALANSSQFGNNARVAPAASVCDGLMDVCFIQKVPIAQMAGFMAKMFTGRIGRSAFVKTIQATQFSAEFTKAIPFHIDGEPFTAVRKFDVEVLPGTLKMLVPVYSGKVR